MVEPRDVSPLEPFASLLTGAGVEFIVVGGQAEVLMGGARVTFDVGQSYTFEVDGEFALDLRAYLEPIGSCEDLDRASLVELEAIKRLRDEEGLR